MTEQEYDEVRALFAIARKQGVDWARMLDTYGKLLTRERAHTIGINTLKDLEQRMDRWQAHEHLRRLHTDGPYTPAQMYEAILSFINEYIALLEKGEL